MLHQIIQKKTGRIFQLRFSGGKCIITKQDRPLPLGGGRIWRWNMYMAAVLHHALVIDIILVLVLVLAVRKENSAFGHAQIGAGCPV